MPDAGGALRVGARVRVVFVERGKNSAHAQKEQANCRCQAPFNHVDLKTSFFLRKVASEKFPAR
jgi:hypothetical protein